MNEVTVTNFRCFFRPQTARIAPLTFLVGNNSTGKTSFLALLRLLWDVAFDERIPDFKESPYDLGTYDDIAHFRGGRGGRASSFEAGFSYDDTLLTDRPHPFPEAVPCRYDFSFRNDDSGVLPHRRRVSIGDTRLTHTIAHNGTDHVKVETGARRWRFGVGASGLGRHIGVDKWERPRRDLPALHALLHLFLSAADLSADQLTSEHAPAQPPTDGDIAEIRRLLKCLPPGGMNRNARPFASAPVRSRPKRTYDPTQSISDPEGKYVPMFLANVARADPLTWNSLRQSIERLGRDAGLFDDIRLNVLGSKAAGPFQLQVRKRGATLVGPYRNIVDVGYGISQVLPVITQLARPTSTRMFLVQQPEVHVHPSAQAALGSFFCNAAANGRQVFVETHSDHLLDRARMDVRDGTTRLRPENVAILYFERRNLSVDIHSLAWDDNGNLVSRNGSIPDGYRSFFRTERRRSIGL